MKGMINTIKSDMKRLNIDLKFLGVAILIIILFLYSDIFLLIPIKLLNIKELSGPVLVMLTALKEIILMIILFFYYRKDLIKEWDTFRANAFTHLDTGVKYWFIGLLVMIGSNLFINLVFNTGGAGNEKAVQQYISYMPWLMVISAGFLAPFVEELVFRKSIRDAFGKNKWLFALASGFIFGFVHVLGNISNWYDYLYIIPYGGLGFAFALAYDETDTVFTSYFLHMIHNTILLIISIMTLGFII